MKERSSIVTKRLEGEGMTLRTFSKLTGIDVVRLSKIERDCCPDVTVGEAHTISETLNIDASYLLDPTYQTEAKKKDDEEQRRFGTMLSARKAIKNDGRPSGIIECPACHGNLGFQIHSNGHVWAKCETPDCLCWIE